MRGMQGMRGILYPRKCYQTFPGKSTKILVNVAKYSSEFPQKFREMSQKILGNAAKRSWEFPQKFRGISSNIL